jgi:hypothetical protein
MSLPPTKKIHENKSKCSKDKVWCKDKSEDVAILHGPLVLSAVFKWGRVGFFV